MCHAYQKSRRLPKMRFQLGMVVSVLLGLSSVLLVCTEVIGDQIATSPDEDNDSSEDSRIIFEHSNEDDPSLRDLRKEEMALEEQERVYAKDLHEYLKNEQRHESERAAFEEEKLKVEKILMEEEVEMEKRKQMLEKLQKEEEDLIVLEKYLEQEEKEIMKGENEETEAMDKLNKRVKEQQVREEEFTQQEEELKAQIKVLERQIKEEELRLQSIHGICVDIPEDLKKHLTSSDKENSKLCFRPDSDKVETPGYEEEENTEEVS